MSIQKNINRPDRKEKIKRLLTIDQVAEVLSVKKSTVYQWVHQELIPYIKLGSLLRFEEQDIEKWIISKKVKPRLNRKVII